MNGMRAVGARLAATTAVTDLTTTGRIWSLRLGNETMPAVRLATVSAVRDHLMGADSGVVRERVQVDSFAATVAGVKALAGEVKTALSRVSGTFGAIVVQDMALENEFDVYEDDASISGSRVYRVTQDYFVWWEE